MNERIPCIGEHRGIGLHDCQDDARLATVRLEIDAVLDDADTRQLVAICNDASWSPEARLTACAKLKAAMQVAIEERTTRPRVDLEQVVAATADLDSQTWRSPLYYAGLCDAYPPAVRRETPLDNC